MSKEQELRQILTRHINPLEWLDEIVPEILQLFQASLPELPLLRGNRPKIVCLCGSGRFRDAFNEAEFNETLAGNIVLTIGCNTKDIARDIDWAHVKPMLDELHLRKIDLADEVLVINVGGYIGESTASEISYAENLGKPIKYLESPT